MEETLPRAADLDVVSGTVTAVTVTVTSDDAAIWLKRNIRNRPTISQAISRYRTEMEAGRWYLTGEPIKFSKTGVLLDGQNRLIALSTTEQPCEVTMMVVLGLDDEAQIAMDQGVRRTAAQQLAMAAVPNASTVAAGIRMHLIWEKGLLFADNKRISSVVTTPRIVEWMEANPEQTRLLSEWSKTVRRTKLRTGVGGAMLLKTYERQPEAAMAFFSILADLSMLPNTHPILALSRRVTRYRDDGLRTSDREQLAVVITAWNAWVRNNKVTKIQLPKGGLTPATFPQVELVNLRLSEDEINRGLGLYLGEPEV